jgi:hypothetical protein
MLITNVLIKIELTINTCFLLKAQEEFAHILSRHSRAC